MNLSSLFSKKCLALLLLALPAALSAQQKELTGLWTGNLQNNDPVVRKDLSFELALTQYHDKIYGYSRRTFLVSDTLYYVIKRVKGKVENGICEVKDDEYLAHNFGKVDKGVKLTYTFRMNEKDSTWTLDGEWTTNQVKKKYYAVDGSVQLAEEKNYTQSKLFDHLEELGLGSDMAFYQRATGKNPAGNIATAKAKKEKSTEKETKEVTTSRKKEDKPAPAAVVTANMPVPEIAASQLAQRKMVVAQEVLFEADSLQIALYDNGEIDGDTVSVLLNGELILSREGLKATALKKMIYLPAGRDTALLTLYAENLGRYPPNTGLLVVYDGETRHQVRFSADLNQNASIIFRRKRK